MSLKMFIYFFLIFSIGVSSKKVRIIGGKDTDIKKFPYNVSLRFYKQNLHFCGGSIISKFHIITAAHCLYERRNHYHNIKIYTGTSSSTAIFGLSFNIANVFYHPDYMKETNEDVMELHDICIIMTTKLIRYNIFQNKINLPTTSITDEYTGILTGWGITSFDRNKLSEKLQEAPMVIYHNSYCSKFVPFVLQDQQFCAYYNENVGACVGDSGSPLVVNGELVGIVSFAFECAKGHPDIYTKIYPYIGFIKDVLRNQFLDDYKRHYLYPKSSNTVNNKI